jgi:hypothetical protein
VNKLEDFFTALESHEFSAIVNLASDFQTFVDILAAEKPVQDLAVEVRSPEARSAVCERALTLAKDQGDGEHEHPWDSALAVYLWLLADKDASLARKLAATIAEAPRCWWARMMAERILSTEQAHAGAG